MASSTTQNVGTVVFGITATCISAITIWQGHRAWKLHRQSHASTDVNGNISRDANCHSQKVNGKLMIYLSGLELGLHRSSSSIPDHDRSAEVFELPESNLMTSAESERDTQLLSHISAAGTPGPVAETSRAL